jgi:ferritin-like metal-binding protein YciE
MKTTATTHNTSEETVSIASKIKTVSLQELFLNQLREIYDAELELDKAFPALINATGTQELKDIFEDHMDVSGIHVSRLEEIWSVLGEKAERRNCLAVRSYIEEAEALINSTSDISTRDMALISIAQKIEHFEIAAYDSLKTIARVLGHVNVADLMQATLDEELDAEERLAALAESCITLDANGNFIAYND